MQRQWANIAKYNARLNLMKAEISLVKADLKLEYLNQMDNLERKRDDFMVKYGQLKETSELGWEDIKEGTEKSWNELKDSIEKAISRFK